MRANTNGSQQRCPRGSAAAALGVVLGILAILPGCLTTGTFTSCCNCQEGPPAGEVTQIFALWASGVVVRPDPMSNGVPTPGLAARVYLSPENGEPVAARGKLTVMLCDDQQPPTNPPAPREIWVIDQANLTRTLKKDGVGWGYSLWLPWRNYKPEIKHVSLVLKYTPDVGSEIWSSNTLLAVNDETSASAPVLRADTTRKAIDPTRELEGKREQGAVTTTITVPRNSSLARPSDE